MIELMIEALTIDNRRHRITRASLVPVLLFAPLFAGTASAQARRPLPVAVFEVRGVTGELPGTDAVTLDDLGLSGGLPERAVGGVAGLHVYPVRRARMALGLGGEGVLVRARADIINADGVLTGQRVVRQLQALAGIVSLNFGHAGGWSHVSAGFGPLRFKNALAPAAVPESAIEAPYRLTLNAGAGARWFLSNHVAFGFDLRMYFIRADVATGASAGHEAARLMLLSAGVTIK